MHPPAATSRLCWEHFFACITNICNQLNPSAAALAAAQGGRTPLASVLSVGAAAGAVAVRAAPLSAKDEEGLMAIIDLIGVSAGDPAVAKNLVGKFDPIKQLFALLACPVQISLKGAVFKALAAFARSCEAGSGVVEEIWGLIEDYRLVPAKAPGDGGGPTATGVRFELESTESRAGVYPCTEVPYPPFRGALACLPLAVLTRDPLFLSPLLVRRRGGRRHLLFFAGRGPDRTFLSLGENTRKTALAGGGS
jgi:hypothetical protein